MVRRLLYDLTIIGPNINKYMRAVKCRPIKMQLRLTSRVYVYKRIVLSTDTLRPITVSLVVCFRPHVNARYGLTTINRSVKKRATNGPCSHSSLQYSCLGQGTVLKVRCYTTSTVLHRGFGNS